MPASPRSIAKKEQPRRGLHRTRTGSSAETGRHFRANYCRSAVGDYQLAAARAEGRDLRGSMLPQDRSGAQPAWARPELQSQLPLVPSREPMRWRGLYSACGGDVNDPRREPTRAPCAGCSPEAAHRARGQGPKVLLGRVSGRRDWSRFEAGHPKFARSLLACSPTLMAAINLGSRSWLEVRLSLHGGRPTTRFDASTI